MITINNFKELDPIKQVHLLLSRGTKLGKARDSGCIKILFEFNNFYAELCYCGQSLSITEVQVSKNFDILDKYVCQFKLEDLY